jgi:hypothetical protein
MIRLFYFLFLVLSLFLLAACFGPKKLAADEIYFGIGACMKIHEGERNYPQIPQEAIDFYAVHCMTNKNLMLNRFIEGPEYLIYISLTFKVIPDDFLQAHYTDTSIQVFDEKMFTFDDNVYKSLLFKRKGFSFYRTLFLQPKHGNLMVFDIMSKDFELITTIYQDEKYFENRFHCE